MKVITDAPQKKNQSGQIGRFIRQAIPNLFTLSSMVCGLAALLVVREQYTSLAACLVLAAMVFDSLDGRTARLIGGMSNFGAQMDSLVDMVSFGVVPAYTVILVLSRVLAGFGISFAIGCFYAAAVAIRLARFNCRLEVSDKNYFEGLPCPAAAGLVMLVVAILIRGSILKLPMALESVRFVVIGITVLVSVLMVSNVPFYNFKHIHWSTRNIVIATAIVAAIAYFFAITWGNWPATVMRAALLIAMFLLLYVISALVIWPIRSYISKHYIRKDGP